MEKCSLCSIEEEKVLYRDDSFVVIQCPECRCPLIVLRKHTTVPSLDARERIERKADEIQAELGEDYIVDRTLFENRQHLHYHIRKI